MPAPGEPGSETWPKGDQWKNGGAPVWVTGNYDPGDQSVVLGHRQRRAVDGRPAAGRQPLHRLDGGHRRRHREIKGHFQYHPNDSWDWDEVSPPILVDFQRNGRTVKGLIDVARNGYLWFLERTDGPIKFVDGTPFVRQNVFRSLDPITGRPDVDPARKPGTGKMADFARRMGRQELAADRLQPQDADDLHPGQREPVRHADRPSRHLQGRQQLHWRHQHALLAEGADHIGEVQGWNVDTGARVWTHTFATSANWGPMLATGGGLAFSGGTNDRMFRAFDAASGKVVWEFPTNSGITGQPTSFAVDGKQYVAVPRAGAWTRAACRRGSTGCSRASSPRCPRAARFGSSRCRSRLRTLASPHHHGRLRTGDCRRNGGDRADMFAPTSASATADHGVWARPERRSNLDAGGLLVMPGGVDSHCHIEQLQQGGGADEETFDTGSRSALAGGTTTVISFSIQFKGQGLAGIAGRISPPSRGGDGGLQLPPDHHRRRPTT